MKSYFSVIFLFLALLSVSCAERDLPASDQDTSSKKYSLPAKMEPLPAITDSSTWKEMTADDSVDVGLSIEKIDNDHYYLVIKMKLYGDSWVVSPLENDFPYGGMSLSIQEADKLVSEDTLIEIPYPEYKYDSAVETPYKVIEKESIIKQKLKRTTQKDFEVSGSLFFVLEPICTPNTIGFTISYRSGEMVIRKRQVN